MAEAASSVGATTQTVGPFLTPAVRGWIVRRGLLIAGAGVGMTLVLTIVAGLAVISGAALVIQSILGPALGGSSPAPTSPAGIPADQVLNGFLFILGFFFFTTNGAPYHLGLGTSDADITGLGALLIALLVIAFSFSSGRALARRQPNASLADTAVFSGLLAVPYWVFGVVLFLASSVHGDLGLLGKVSAGPTWPGLVLPLLIVGLPALAGSTIGHTSLSGDFARGLIRGAGFGLVAILLGVIGTLLGVVLAGIVNAIGGSGQKTPFGTNLPSAPKSTSGPSGNSSSAAASGVLFLVAAIVVGLIYLLNAVALLWAGNLAIALTGWSLWPLVLLLGLAGAVIGAMPLRLRTDYSEKIGFVICFGMISFLLALFSHPALGSYELGPQPGTVLLVALVLGAVLSVGGPFLATTSVGKMALGMAPVAALVGRAESVFGPAETDQPKGEATGAGFHLVWNRSLAVGLSIAGVVALVLIGGGVYGASVTSPEAIAKSYVSDVGSNDPTAVWNDIEVSAPSGSTQHLTGQSDLKAMLALSANHHPARSAITTTRTDTNGTSSTVTVSWKEGSQTPSETLVLHRAAVNRYLFFPDWRIVTAPSILSFSLPAPDTKVTVDGSPVAASGSSVTVAVFPGNHQVTASASSLFAADTQSVNASGTSTAVKFSLNLTSTASAAIKKSIGDFFATCVAATVASPNGCPQSSFESGSGYAWKLVGDPAATLGLSLDSSNKVHAVGHYLMLDTFNGTFPNGVRHRVEGGPYEAVMAWTGSSMNIDTVSQTFNATQLTAPAGVTAADVSAAVSAAFQACTTAPADGSPDCPQDDFVFDASNFHWTLKGDPLAGASVSFDADKGFWKVTGNYTFHDSYDESYLGHQESDRSGTYSAYAIYNGTKVVAVYISRF